MAAGGFKTFVAGEILTAADTNSFLMQGVLVFDDATARDAAITAPVEGQFVFRTDEDVLEFFDGTEFVEVSGEPGSAVISATTGSPTETTIVVGDETFDVFQFTGDGSITISDAGFAELLVVGGGGAGGSGGAGGGGAGGHLPLTNAFLGVGTATIVVGAGGAGVSGNSEGFHGFESQLGAITSVFGGGGAFQFRAFPGGSGGGGAGNSSANSTLPGRGIPGQGNFGGNGLFASPGFPGGGGGGANAVGGNAANSTTAGNGGEGLANSITGSSVTRAGGGGGGTKSGTSGTGGAGGGGAGSTGSGTSGVANSGGGGGGSGSGTSGAGGSGIVIVRVAV